MAARRGVIRIGVSGWTYAPWRGRVFPKGLPRSRELGHIARLFPTIEVNGTFYALQRAETYRRWGTEVPAGFIFAVKGPRFLTHLRRLQQPEIPLANFLASGPLALGPKLGPVLWQFPPSFRFDPDRLEPFLALLPRTTRDAAALARRHDHRVREPWLSAGRNRRLRHAVEIRHDSFRDPAFPALLRRYGVALVCADTVEWPRLMDLTSDFVYCRLHGAEELYRSAYDDVALDRWAARITAWAEGRVMTGGDFADPDHPGRPRPRDVYLYFDNTDKMRAPEDADRLAWRVSRITSNILSARSEAR